MRGTVDVVVFVLALVVVMLLALAGVTGYSL